MSMATLFSPMPRNPPTPTMRPENLAVLVEQHVVHVADLRVVRPITSVPLNFENTH
jgi:hypothetical protein